MVRFSLSKIDFCVVWNKHVWPRNGRVHHKIFLGRDYGLKFQASADMLPRSFSIVKLGCFKRNRFETNLIARGTLSLNSGRKHRWFFSSINKYLLKRMATIQRTDAALLKDIWEPSETELWKSCRRFAHGYLFCMNPKIFFLAAQNKNFWRIWGMVPSSRASLVDKNFEKTRVSVNATSASSGYVSRFAASACLDKKCLTAAIV